MDLHISVLKSSCSMAEAHHEGSRAVTACVPSHNQDIADSLDQRCLVEGPKK